MLVMFNIKMNSVFEICLLYRVKFFFMKQLLIFFSLVFYGNSNGQNINKAIIKEEFIFDQAPFKECHAPTIESTPSGLVASWFGGTKEKNKDVEIWLSRRDNNGWSKPVSVANGIQHDKKRYPCWNPVLFKVPDGPLMLFYNVHRNHKTNELTVMQMMMVQPGLKDAGYRKIF